MTETLEHTAQRIADRGREALIERLRPAFREAAANHADVLELSDEQLEQMVQRAADRADGLQWRRALASVAAEDLGISLGEALSHPAVERAQAIVGAPSYEDSLQTLAARRSAPATEHPAADASAAEPPATDAPEAEASDVEPAAEEPDATAAEPEDTDDEADHDEDADDEALYEDEDEDEEYEDDELYDEDDEDELEAVTNGNGEGVRVAVIHLGGVANLTPGERDIELRLSGHGLDIVRGRGETLGRLTWPEIRSLGVPPAKGLRKRRRENRAHLVVRTDHGDASFEVPAVGPDELRAHLAPVVERYGRAVEAR